MKSMVTSCHSFGSTSCRSRAQLPTIASSRFLKGTRAPSYGASSESGSTATRTGMRPMNSGSSPESMKSFVVAACSHQEEER